MKKLLLGLGTIAAVTAPVVSVVACGANKDKEANDYLESGLTLDKMELIGHYVHIESLTNTTKHDELDSVVQYRTISRTQMTDISCVKSMVRSIKEYQMKEPAWIYSDESEYTNAWTGLPTSDAIIQIIYTNGKVVRKSLNSLVDYLMYINDISNVNLQQWETEWTSN